MILYAGDFWPALSVETQIFLRSAYAVLMAATLIQNLPSWRLLLLTEKWGGYVDSTPRRDRIQNPRVMPWILAAWFGALILLFLGRGSVWAAALNLGLCHYFFIQMRWKTLARGWGAPGFMSFWMGAAIFLLEASSLSVRLRGLALLALQVDFALIMFSAGVSKITTGYARNHGMELGMVNPMWGYWDKIFRKWSPNHPLFHVLNQTGWFFEVVGAALMLVPTTRMLGGACIFFGFLFVLTQIRLGPLCLVLMTASLIFVFPGSLPDQILARWVGGNTPPPLAAWPWIEPALYYFLCIYLVLRPLAFLAVNGNFYFQLKYPRPLQNALNWFTNTFGVILWRVFTVDVINFYVEVFRVKPDGTEEHLSRYRSYKDRRFNTVVEAITVAVVFNALKYFVNGEEVFKGRILRYAATLPPGRRETYRFHYVSIKREKNRFAFIPLCDFFVNAESGRVESVNLTTRPFGELFTAESFARKTAAPGTYLPAPAPAT